jgi:biotin transport system substrate-specific component
MIAGAYLKIPIGPVPIVLTNFVVMLAGLILGAKWGLASVGVYLLLGIVGLPVFAGGSGLAYVLGPTGGYLLAFLPAVAIFGVISSGRKSVLWRDAAALICGSVAIYMIGVPWLKVAARLTWESAVSVGMLPFLFGDAVKIAAATATVAILRKAYPELLLRPETASQHP